jgi:glycerophosphoryl diester phosphodiesterase
MLRRTALALAVVGATVTIPLGTAPVPAVGATGDAGVPCTARTRPTVIGHRGAWGYRPEHTLESYRLAIALGANYIEQDLVSTKDGALIARNSNELSGTTDVANHPEFAGRRTTKVVDGVSLTGWFSEDFTLAEVRTLRARERMPDIRPDNARYDGLFGIPTLQEVIDLARAEGIRRHKRIGIYPETKRPTYFRSIGLPLEERLVAALRRNGLTRPGARVPVFLQSFEPSSLQRLDRMVRLPKAQLVDAVGKPYDFVVSGDPRTFADLVTPEGLRWVRGYADAVAVNKDLIVPRDATGHLLAPTTLVRDAHRAHVAVHAWRFANENTYLPADFRVGTDPAAWGRSAAEYRAFYRLGIDGVISDFPDAAVAVRHGCRPPRDAT